ncbi:MAG: methyltransferase [Candidatus Hermodarchaeota archaeon]|nr:methyltransferase [Candidatus Hermodarchaeota archaeon]
MEKILPEVKLGYGDLYEILIAPIKLKLLLTSIELKVFNELSKPKSADAVAKTLNTDPTNTRLFLDGLAAIDLLEKTKGLYKNSSIAQTFLIEGGPTYLGRILPFLQPDAQVFENLTKLVKEGPLPQPETPPFSEEAVAQGVVMMADAERAGYTQEAVKIVLELPEFPSFQKMLDLGGGPGLIGMAIVAEHPNMKAINFDLPPVARKAKAYIREYGMEDRMEILVGDFNQDSIGEGYDLVWASGVLQFAFDIDYIVKKVYESLNPGGVFVSLYPFAHTHERTKPEPVILGLLSMALMGHEAGIERGYVADSMKRAGFKSVHSRNMDTLLGPMDLDIARK